MTSSLSFQSLNQSRTSIHSIGLDASQPHTSAQIPSYCTLPRQSIGQTASGSAFHPVAKSAPNTPKTERAAARTMLTAQNMRSESQYRRSLSQPTSPTSSATSHNMPSVYSVKRDVAEPVDTPVQVVPAKERSSSASGWLFFCCLSSAHSQSSSSLKR